MDRERLCLRSTCNRCVCYQLIVFNSFGEKMFYQEDLDSLISVDVSTLSQGTYYVVLTGDKYRKSFKFTKV